MHAHAAIVALLLLAASAHALPLSGQDPERILAAGDAAQAPQAAWSGGPLLHPGASHGNLLLQADPAVWLPVFEQRGYGAAVAAAKGALQKTVWAEPLGDADGDGRADHLLSWSTSEEDEDGFPIPVKDELVAVSATGTQLWRLETDGEDAYLGVFGDANEDGVVDAMRVSYGGSGEDTATVEVLDGRTGQMMWSFPERFSGSYESVSQGANGVRASQSTYVVSYESITDRWDGQPGAFFFRSEWTMGSTTAYASAPVAFAYAGLTSDATTNTVGVVQDGKVAWEVSTQGERSAWLQPLGDLDGDGHDDFAFYDAAGTRSVSLYAYAVAGGDSIWQTVPAAMRIDFVSGKDGRTWQHTIDGAWDFALASGAGDLRGKGGELAFVAIQANALGLSSHLVLLDKAGSVVDEREYEGIVPILTPWPDIDGDGDGDLILVEATETGAVVGAADETLVMKWRRDVSDEMPFAWYPGLPSGPMWLPDLTGDGVPDVTLTTAFFDDGSVVAIDAVTGKELWQVDTESGFDISLVGDVHGDGIDDVVQLVFDGDTWDNSTGRIELRRGSDLELYWSKVVHDPGDNRTIDGPVVQPYTIGDADGDGRADLLLGVNTIFQFSFTCDLDGCTIDSTTDPWTAAFVVSSRSGATLAAYNDRLPLAVGAPDVELGSLGHEMLDDAAVGEDSPGAALGLAIVALALVARRRP